MSTTCPCTSLGWECELSWWWSSQRGSFSRPTLQKLYEEVKNIFQTKIPVSVREFLAAVASSTLSKVRKAKPRDWGIGNEIKSDLNFNLLPKEFWHGLSPSWERSFVKLEIMMILQRKSTHLARFSVQDNLAFLKRPKPPKLLLQVPSWDQFSPWGLLDLGLSWGGRVKQWRMVMNLFLSQDVRRLAITSQFWANLDLWKKPWPCKSNLWPWPSKSNTGPWPCTRALALK